MKPYKLKADIKELAAYMEGIKMDRKLLGKRINEVRKERGYTADKLSELCHINATYLRQIEGGAKIPSLPVFTDICNALKISPAYLLKDALVQNELSSLGELSALWENATPGQIRLITAMVRAALEHKTAE